MDAARGDIEDGYVFDDLFSTVRATTEAELLTQARSLVEQGDGWAAAAMLLGSCALELHLRDVCDRYALKISGIPGIGAYAKAIANHRSVYAIFPVHYDTKIKAWKELRNAAAHAGDFELTATQVEAELSGIESFLADAR